MRRVISEIRANLGEQGLHVDEPPGGSPRTRSRAGGYRRAQEGSLGSQGRPGGSTEGRLKLRVSVPHVGLYLSSWGGAGKELSVLALDVLALPRGQVRFRMLTSKFVGMRQV